VRGFSEGKSEASKCATNIGLTLRAAASSSCDKFNTKNSKYKTPFENPQDFPEKRKLRSCYKRLLCTVFTFQKFYQKNLCPKAQ
jgi:hypothetical protein